MDAYKIPLQVIITVSLVRLVNHLLIHYLYDHLIRQSINRNLPSNTPTVRIADFDFLKLNK